MTESDSSTEIQKPKPSFCLLNDRVRLWKEDPHFPPWAWVVNEPINFPGGYDTLEKNLKAHAKKDKCRIRFAQLYGPDCTPKDHFHEMTIISNIAREATYDQHGVIQDFCQHGFGPWIVDDEKQRAQHHQAAAQTYSGNPDLKAPPRTLLAQLGNLSFPNSVSVCWQKRITPPKSLRFLRSTSEQHTPFRGISFSSIHRLLYMLGDQDTELKSALELLALSPQLLWDMLKSTSAQRKKAQERHKTIGMYHCAIGQAFDANKSEHVSVLVQALKTTTHPNTTAARGQKREIADDSELPNLRKKQRICYKFSSTGVATGCVQYNGRKLVLDNLKPLKN